MSMAARSSDLDDQKSGVVIQTKGHTLTPLSGQNGPDRDRVHLVVPCLICHPIVSGEEANPWTAL